MSNDLPNVSVAVPCFNSAHVLVPTLESILAQDYPHIECIVVDGASTDGTREILSRYANRVRWVSEPDRGSVDAINKGLRMSRGEILTWLNADDVWMTPGAVRQAVSYLGSHPDVDVVYGDCALMDERGMVVGMLQPREWDLAYAVEYCDHVIYQPASFIRRRVLEAVGWLDTNFRFNHDHELWYRIGLRGTIRHLPVTLAGAGSHPSFYAQSGDKTARGLVALTEKFFTLPNVPAVLRRRRRRAISNSYLRGMEWAWFCGKHWPVIWSYGLRAAATDPSNLMSAMRHLAGFARVGTVQGVLALLSAAKRGVMRWAARATAVPVLTERRKEDSE